ncbi:hypothetical protein K469DRAFT_754691 [Zopfia rhizophila CBS 207.26]|uniref:Rhodopsin domain-containing protein n=1 Tax=Zopfia rhizophila CBS 207.26 TaxID=1314779 RepID=A0A6A6DGX5_9PEZI|nr:hypothetical protein K469DRAFT_754691 [Zopfia rhizophila CBS 207.26]
MTTTDPHAPPDVNTALGFLIPGWILFGIALTCFIVRIHTRLHIINRLYADDYAIFIAMLILIFEMPFVTVSCYYGLGRYEIYVSPENAIKAVYFLYISIFPLYIAIAASRVSIGLTLLRLKKDSKSWTYIIWIVLWVQILQGLAFTVIQLVQCRPLRALWKTTPNMQCLDIKFTNIWAWITSGISIATDIFFAITPITFIGHLRRPLLERFLIVFLMALGLVASSTAIIKMVHLAHYMDQGFDRLHDMLDLTIWVKVEEILIIIAACAPVLKSPVERLLRRIGILVVRSKEYFPHLPSKRGDERKVIGTSLGTWRIVEDSTGSTGSNLDVEQSARPFRPSSPIGVKSESAKSSRLESVAGNTMDGSVGSGEERAEAGKRDGREQKAVYGLESEHRVRIFERSSP